MSYFLPSSFQKRLLRYALSRLELVDTDALDLERLDIEWGRRSTVELRDVGLRKNKLASLLDIPEYLKIEYASIARLRITIPADIHTSAIIFEVRGVEARLKLLDDAGISKPESAKKSRDSANVQTSRRIRKEVQFSTLRSSIQQEGSMLSSDDDDDRLPTAHDLAASFLAEEPLEEKEQLEAAYNSQSTADLRQSIVSTGSGDDETNVGTGLVVGLPSFLAAFLKGIGDRLQVQIRNVTIKLEANLDAGLETGLSRNRDEIQGPTTVALYIDEIDVCEVETVTTSTNASKTTSQKDKAKDPVLPASSTEKRRIILKNLLASVLSDNENLYPSSPVLHERLVGQPQQSPTEALVPQGDSSTQSSAPPVPGNSPPPLTSVSPLKYSDHNAVPSRDLSSDSSEHRFYFDTENSEVSSTASVQDLNTSTRSSLDLTASGHNDRLLSELDEAIEQSVAYSKMASTKRTHSPLATPLESYSGQLHSSLRTCREEKSPMTSSSALRSRGRSSRSSSSTKSSSSFPRSRSPSSEALRNLQHRSASPDLSSSRSTEMGRSKTGKTVKSAVHEMPLVEDNLTQSMMFSHEEAESIYMSVVEETQSSSSRSLHIPGAWDESNDLELLSKPSGTLHIEPPTTGDGRTLSFNPAKHDESFAECTNSEASKTGFGEPPQFTNSSAYRYVSARTFLKVDEADFWISTSSVNVGTAQKSSTPSTAGLRDLNRSEHQQLPGSFSSYAESRSSMRSSGFVPHMSFEYSKNNSDQHQNAISEQAIAPTLYELVLHSAQAKIDVSLSKVFAELLHKFQVTSHRNAPPSSAKSHNNPDNKDLRNNSSTFTARVNNMTMEMLEVFESHTLLPSGELSNEDWTLSKEGLLFTLKASGFEWSTMTVPMPQSKLEIGKLSFGFNDQEIISFSKQAKIRSSMRDLQVPFDKDISIIIGQAKNTTEINVNTKPIQISLNLQRLDNTLGSMGGLSGLMDLGSSADSESTVMAQPTKSGQRPRGVHFAEGLPANESQKAHQKPRFNVRIGGVAAVVEGKHCSIKLHSTAIKLVGRDAVFGLQVDDIRLTGPYTKVTTAEAGISVRLKNTSLKYLTMPEEHDLTRLISLLTPSKDKFEDDDDFLVDTLIRQRRKGAVLRTNVAKLEFRMQDIHAVKILQDLVDDVAKMSTVTRYLPEESRPGLMTLGTIEHATFDVQTDHRLGPLSMELKTAEFAHITLPSLIAISLGKIAFDREEEIAIITEVLPLSIPGQPPMLMARLIGDEMEPTVKLKLWNMCFEYNVPLIMALLDIPDDTKLDGRSIDLSASIAALTEPREMLKSNTTAANDGQRSGATAKPLAINLALRDCAIGLTPRNMPSKALFVVTDGCICGALPDDRGLRATIELRKAGVLIIDDSRKLAHDTEPSLVNRSPSSAAVSNHIPDLCSLGYVSVSAISAAMVMVKLTHGSEDAADLWDIEFKDELFLLETCADSTQTLIETLNGLKPPFPPSKGEKYRTEIAPMQDMMASFTGDAFALGRLAPQGRGSTGFDDISDEDLANEFDDLSDFTGIVPNAHPILGDRLRGYSSAHLEALSGAMPGSNIRTALDAMGPRVDGAAGHSRMQAVGKKWDSTNNRYVTVDSKELALSPVQLRIRDVHVIWHLFDGYDWERTRDTITKAVHDVEAKAEERRFGRRFEENDDKESVIGDFLFNSIYIGIPVNQDPQELTRQINRNLDDLVSETASHTSTANSRPTSSHRPARNQGKKLKLDRSKRHKVAFELRGVSADIFAFAPGDETQTSIDLRINDFEIFDHVPTSTWKKFATYMYDSGPRDEQKPMVHLELCDVRPVPELTATELVIRVTVLPVRLHVDQDALDFITRFFDFQDDSRDKSGPPAEQPYLQRVEVRAVPIKLDYKPKKVDYAGLRSGRTTEFMNFFILDGADMVLKHTIVYGTSGFVKLHKSLEDVWMPDIRRNQLPSVLSGLNGVRTLVNVGTGIRDLVVIPVREYKKDGRIVRSISKGALAFAKQTGGELTRFGAKLAIGAQTALQGAEEFFVKPGYPQIGGNGEPGWDGDDMDVDERRAISHYANQPTGILQGLKGAARSLERDLLVTKDIIIAVSGEARESGTAEGAARAVARHAPTLILRPMIGASKAISQTLMGATNTVDPQNRRRVEDKYKRY